MKSAGVALKGITEEFDIGRRTLLDILDARQEFNDAKVSLVSAQRDKVVFTFTVLGAVGRLNARSLKLPVPYYNIEVDYDATKYNLINTSIELDDRAPPRLVPSVHR